MKMSFLSKLTYKFKTIPIKIPVRVFTELESPSQNSYDDTRAQNSQDKFEEL